MKRNIFIVIILPFLFTPRAEAKSISRSQAREIAGYVAVLNDTASDNIPDEPYYVFSRGKGMGYVIVSGDDRAAPVIGIVESGDYIWDELPEAMRLMLKRWSEMINGLRQKPDTRKTPMKAKERLEAARRGVDSYKENWKSVNTLIETKWSQYSPYNLKCPYILDSLGQSTGSRAVTGCVATAGSQLLYYFRGDVPDTVVYNTPTYSYGSAPVTESIPAGTAIEYDDMKLSGSGTTLQNNAVATLMIVVGTSSYLTYGSSTAGQLGEYNGAGLKKALADQFRLYTTDCWRSLYTLRGWETLLYNNISTGHPVAYAGANINTDLGAHAFICDGYLSSTGLWHFNWGWGGAGDGYFTVDDSTGVNGWSLYQEILSMPHPARQSLTGSISADAIYDRCTNILTCEVTNHGTLDYSGFKLYASTTGKRPSTASATSDITVESGQTASFSFSYKPTQQKIYYFFLTDNENNILDTLETEALPSIGDISLTAMDIDAGDSTTEMDGMTFRRVNNTEVNVSATIVNSETGTYCDPQVKCLIKKYNSETKEWEAAKSRTITIQGMRSGETRDTVYNFRSLSPGVYYKAVFDRTVKTGETGELKVLIDDSVKYFTVIKPTLTITPSGRTAAVSGDWNAALFTLLAADSTVTVYDLSGVNGINSQPECANPNALFLVPHTMEGTYNTVSGGQCADLRIIRGYPFSAPTPFTAVKAAFSIPGLTAGVWTDVIIPFDVQRSQGVVMRKVARITNSTITMTSMNSAHALTPMLVMSDYDRRAAFTAEDVTVSADTIGTICGDSVSGSTTPLVLHEKALILGYNSATLTPMYLTADSGTALLPMATVIHTASRQLTPYPSGVYRGYMALADTLNHALSLYYAYLPALEGEDFFNIYADSISASEALFMAQDATSGVPLTRQARYLGSAIEAFLGANATGIEIIGGEEQSGQESYNAAVYDLSGREVGTAVQGAPPAGLKRGLYIIGRKKYLLK